MASRVLVSRLQRIQLSTRAHRRHQTLRGIRACISGIMQVAIDHDVLSVNPVASVRKIEGGPKRAARAYDETELVDFLAKLDADRKAVKADLPDLIRFLFGTSCRFGEALAVRWYDLNLTDEVVPVVAPDGVRVKLPPHTVFFNGNIVHVKGQGLVRNEGETASSRGILSLPDFLHTLLLVRAPAMAMTGAGTMEPVFPSGTLGWRAPVQRPALGSPTPPADRLPGLHHPRRQEDRRHRPRQSRPELPPGRRPTTPVQHPNHREARHRTRHPQPRRRQAHRRSPQDDR